MDAENLYRRKCYKNLVRHQFGSNRTTQFLGMVGLAAGFVTHVFAQAPGPSGDGGATLLLLVIIVTIVALVLRIRLSKARKRNAKSRKVHAKTVEQEWEEIRNFSENEESSDTKDRRNTEVVSVERSPMVFISYRRDESADVTGRICDRLADRFGSKRIFKDVDSIPMGSDFRQHIDNAVAQTEVMLVVIGRNWVGKSAETGQRRIDDPKDFPRLEVRAALQKQIPIIPLLVGGGTIPPSEDLPSEIAEISFRNCTQVRPDPDFRRDIERLLEGIEAAAAQYRAGSDL